MLSIAERTRLNKWAPVELMGQYLHQKRGVLKCVYDFSVNGGAVSTIALVDDAGNPAILPIKAIVTQVYSDTVTAVTTSASGTLSLGANTTTDLYAATAAASFTGIQAGTPVGTAATMVKLTAQRTISATIATGALTAGKVNYFVEFVISD
jgi:hypothetical protein